MNAFKFNGQAGHLTRQAIVTSLNIPWTDLYKVVKDINHKGIIETKDGKKYKLILEEIKTS